MLTAIEKFLHRRVGADVQADRRKQKAERFA